MDIEMLNKLADAHERGVKIQRGLVLISFTITCAGAAITSASVSATAAVVVMLLCGLLWLILADFYRSPVIMAELIRSQIHLWQRAGEIKAIVNQ
jgi:hypothetical protein